jgi:hypothetical protein
MPEDCVIRRTMSVMVARLALVASAELPLLLALAFHGKGASLFVLMMLYPM